MSKSILHYKKYLISDWDGTLAQSFDSLMGAYSKVMRKNFGISKKECINFIVNTNGRPLSFQIKELAKCFGYTVDDTTEFEEEFWELMEGKIPKPITGAREFLTEIKKRDFHIVVWSGTRTESLEKQIKALKFDSFIDFYIGLDAGTTSKNKAILFPKIVDFYKTKKENLIKASIILGDGLGDIESGKDLGINTIAFLNNGKNKLENSKADFSVNTYKEILQLLK